MIFLAIMVFVLGISNIMLWALVLGMNLFIEQNMFIESEGNERK
jgi:hypothetical protein